MGVVAFRITAAGKESSVLALFYNHWLFAFITKLVRNFFNQRFYGMNLAFFIAGVVPGIAAFRVPVASEEMPVFADLNMEFGVALGTGMARG